MQLVRSYLSRWRHRRRWACPTAESSSSITTSQRISYNYWVTTNLLLLLLLWILSDIPTRVNCNYSITISVSPPLVLLLWSSVLQILSVNFTFTFTSHFTTSPFRLGYFSWPGNLRNSYIRLISMGMYTIKVFERFLLNFCIFLSEILFLGPLAAIITFISQFFKRNK